MDWRSRAACLGEDPELFFPSGRDDIDRPETAAPKAVCARCVVVHDCLAEALDTHQNEGVWGGMTTFERRELLRRRDRATGRAS